MRVCIFFLFATIVTEAVGAQGIFRKRNEGNRVRALVEEVFTWFMSPDPSLLVSFGGGIDSPVGTDHYSPPAGISGNSPTIGKSGKSKTSKKSGESRSKSGKSSHKPTTTPTDIPTTMPTAKPTMSSSMSSSMSMSKTIKLSS